jgi:hypothetical protein
MLQIKVWWIVGLISILTRTTMAAERCPAMFFDLGETLIDTATNNYNPMFYMTVGPGFHDHARFPTGKEYIDTIDRQYGLSMGLLMDVPGEWGTPEDPALQPIRDLMAAKFLRTEEFLLGQHPDDHSSWTGIPFDWSPFGGLTGAGASRVLYGRIFEPRDDSERKHARSLVLFQRALAVSGGCPAIYQGGIEDEMALAQAAGMITFWVGHTSSTFYLPPERINAYIQFARTPRPPGAPPYWRGPF